MNIKVIIGIVVIIIVAAGVSIYTSSLSKKVISDPRIPEGSVMIQKENDAVADNGETMMKVGSYEAYSPEKIARAETGDVVLFFHASWCPSCRGLNSDIEKNSALIPEGLSILKVDYDKETELKKKYGITYQHTLVQVDKDGNLIKKWSGSPKLDNILSEIK